MKTILIIDRDETSIKLYKQFIKDHNNVKKKNEQIRMLDSYNLEHALEKIKYENDNDGKIDLIVSEAVQEDVKMFEVFEILKHHDIPMLALTGRAMAGEKAQCLCAGADDYLTKPVVKCDFLEKVVKMLHNKID